MKQRDFFLTVTLEIDLGVEDHLDIRNKLLILK
jgi:hypothetical protein